MKHTDRPFFYGATKEIFVRAKELRKNMTQAESLLWEKLKMNRLGKRVYRQHPIGKFIVDFYCHRALLVIELDGRIHDRKEISERDEGREYELKRYGLNIIRFRNEEVFNNIDIVIEKIKACISSPPTSP